MRKVFSFFTVFVLLCGFSRAAVHDYGQSYSTTRDPDQTMRTETSREDASRTETIREEATIVDRGRSVNAPKTRETSTVKPQLVSRSTVQNKIIRPAMPPKATHQIVQRSAATPSASLRTRMASPATRNTANAARSVVSAVNRGRTAIATKIAEDTTVNQKYTTCRKTYFSCMDEFCANKDASLRRCACSDRLHDFDDDKKVLEDAKEKLTDYNERLLAVNMDKEDALAMNESTVGEDASAAKDKSASQKVLDDILKKINEKTTDTEQTQSLAMIDLSASNSMADVFDPVDYVGGASTTLKEGEALYRAALPVCVDMAIEVCDPEDINIIQSAYEMSVEQDCNTLAKNYELLKNTALGKITEGSALLDMSRLTNYQDRNSGDALLCTKQMMEVMTTDSVCGEDLSKCLDWSGKYIDPLTGGAILSSDLANLSDILVKPEENQKWGEVPANLNMVRFLESKKTYIEPAMENCDTISTVVWDNFMENALAKVKTAQNARLESMRQNCTSIISKCKTSTEKSIQDFDARALSIFGVSADSSVNQMCNDVQSACTALMKKVITPGDEVSPGGDSQTGVEWEEGIENIDAQKTYETILQNCKLIGQECIQQQCRTSENQFELCLTQTSSQRRSILSQTMNTNYCYGEVLNCVDSAASADFDRMVEQNPEDFVDGEYDYADTNQIKIAKNIWGHCSLTNMTDKTNAIVMNNDSILAWFGENTDSGCYTGYCPEDTYYTYENYSGSEGDNQCNLYASSAYEYCGDGSGIGGIIGDPILDPAALDSIIQIHNSIGGLPRALFYESEGVGYFTNCCLNKTKDSFGNCCESMGMAQTLFTSGIPIIAPARPPAEAGLCDPERQCCFEWDSEPGGNGTTRPDVPDGNYCKPTGESGWEYVAASGGTRLFCLGILNDQAYGEDDTVDNKTCQGTFVTVGTTGTYHSRTASGSGIERYLNYYYDNISNLADDVDSHHILYIHVQKDSYGPDYPSEAGYYKITKNGTIYSFVNPFVTDPNGIHRVAYCENGFWIESDNSFGCCTIAAPCDNYYIR